MTDVLAAPRAASFPTPLSRRRHCVPRRRWWPATSLLPLFNSHVYFSGVFAEHWHLRSAVCSACGYTMAWLCNYVKWRQGACKHYSRQNNRAGTHHDTHPNFLKQESSMALELFGIIFCYFIDNVADIVYDCRYDKCDNERNYLRIIIGKHDYVLPYGVV